MSYFPHYFLVSHVFNQIKENLCVLLQSAGSRFFVSLLVLLQPAARREIEKLRAHTAVRLRNAVTKSSTNRKQNLASSHKVEHTKPHTNRNKKQKTP